MSTPFRVAIDAPWLDIGLLHYRDRAALRILDRAEAATPRQLAILVYGHRRVAQRRLRRLWHAGLLERAIVPHAQHGAAELAYRLSYRARRRLGDTATRARGSNRLGHTLDTVETICALVPANGDPRTNSPVRLWLDEPNAAAVLGTPPYPDGVVVVQVDGRSGVICLEIDEATQRRAVIEAKLNGYRRLFDEHPEWWLLFVVPSKARAGWLRLVAKGAEETVVAHAWVTTITELRLRHLDARVGALVNGRATTVRGLARSDNDQPEGPSVGSEAWLHLLGEGGIEDLDEILA
jgi:hypothetical protein